MKKIIFILFIISSILNAQTGPGGIGTDDGSSALEYWVDASRNITGTAPISGWLDLSGNNITNTIIGDPSLNINVINGYNSVTFDGVGDRIRTNLNINYTVFPNVTIISVYTPRINNSGGVWGEDNSEWDRFILDADNVASFLGDMVSDGEVANNDNNNIANIYPTATPVITSVIYRNAVVNGTEVYANENLERSFTSNQTTTSNNFMLGDIGSERGIYDFDGDIKEVIVYSTDINTSQRIIIDNYLSAKYNRSLVTNNFYNEDENGDFDHKVAGIGQATDGSNHTDSEGTGIIRINTPSDLQNNEYLLWGENVINSDYAFSQVGKRYKINSTWRVSETGDLGDVNFFLSQSDIDLTGVPPGVFKLVRSTVSDFSTIAKEYDLTLAGGTYSGTVAFNDNDYFTLMVVPSVDLKLTKTVDTAIPKVGDVVTFSLSLTNSGPQSATGVQVRDLLPSGLIYNAGSSTIGLGTYNAVSGLWDLSGVTITSGQTITVQIAATVDSAGTFTNTIEVINVDQEDIDSDSVE